MPRKTVRLRIFESVLARTMGVSFFGFMSGMLFWAMLTPVRAVETSALIFSGLFAAACGLAAVAGVVVAIRDIARGQFLFDD